MRSLHQPRLFHERAEGLAASLVPLMVRAPRTTRLSGPGIHGRRRTGVGEAFWQFRRFTWGDPVRSIDWRRSARGNALFVRETEQESAQTVWLWRDGSGSMAYRGARAAESKDDRVRLMLLALTLALRQTGEGVRLLGSPARLNAWDSLAYGADSVVAGAAEAPPDFRALPRAAVVILATDGLQSLDLWAQWARELRQQGCRGAWLVVRDRDEMDFPFQGCVDMHGMENEGARLLPDAGAMREGYRAALATHDDRLGQLIHAAHGKKIMHLTDQQPADALAALAAFLAEGG